MNGEQQLFGCFGICLVVAGTSLHGFNGRGDGGLPGEYQYRCSLRLGNHPGAKRFVTDNYVGTAKRAEFFGSPGHRLSGEHSMTISLKPPGKLLRAAILRALGSQYGSCGAMLTKSARAGLHVSTTISCLGILSSCQRAPAQMSRSRQVALRSSGETVKPSAVSTVWMFCEARVLSMGGAPCCLDSFCPLA